MDTDLRKYLQHQHTWKEKNKCSMSCEHPSYTVVGKEYTFTSDIYSFRILTLEISSNQIPFERDYDLAMKIVYSMRSEIKTFQYILVSPIDFSKNEENS
ncbi:kinase-like domain-containing protein [Rhizophagus irregularis DAOM 181602=DAOM 197198]|uniref:Uncharacterized protein n=1 Tax=Rhizophagus irregularis (strain DAOM 181602 / DAOM 197198 / MUCL 43194) TaxID=747089 RepID=A0A2P4Q912_RHIID|nr:hypothetical protein GLOIN_2v1771753 [Rhizophagus irregularis DAOM 181602=DAOM 197198]POG74140.1 hypothetical protein GLOIN_2v1771753 [Rhizophagus irregularis DAOM 181602=DAOM 197198]GET51956.1 kinase-like domain-containing protein [Rhizophagus irregularis DAOM 181602=DAOM 197198]|eukprot:XP_025181006.1 hypothetical protein GLOIN_2v1771753 [Rhizophagus irregularis DAOM 181602=DAOM 197198]